MLNIKNPQGQNFVNGSSYSDQCVHEDMIQFVSPW